MRLEYPKIKDMPLFLDTASWLWSRTKRNFWIGQEVDGTKWLVKGRGSVCALREHSSAYLMQTLGINCQSSVYIMLHENSLPVTDNLQIDRFQFAVLYIHEHNDECDLEYNCPKINFNENLNSASTKIYFLKTCPVPHAIDLVKVELLACLCGANEPSGILMSKKHVMYIIDNEEMFSISPNSPISGAKRWFNDEHDAAMQLTLELCQGLSVITDSNVQTFTNIPNGYVQDCEYPIAALMKESVLFAKKFLAKYSLTCIKKRQ